MKIAYVHRNDGSDTRVIKECNSLRAAGHDVTFVGWRKSTNKPLPDRMPGVAKSIFTAKGGPQSFRHYPTFATFVAYTLARLRPDVVQCVNEDTASIAILLKPLLGWKVVCDVFDSASLRWGDAPFPLGSTARVMSRFAHAGSDVLIVTDERRQQRLGRFASKSHIVANYPVDVGEQAARSTPEDSEGIRLYVAGTLYRDRGLATILALLELRSDVRVIAAGWVLDDLARAFIKHDRVDYRGVVAPTESLHLAASCHAIVAMYAPNEENNILASPNKVYDALCVGRRVIVNEDVLISDWVRRLSTGYVVPYGDVRSLSGVVDRLLLDRARIADDAAILRGYFESEYNWAIAERTLLTAIESLNAERTSPGRPALEARPLTTS